MGHKSRFFLAIAAITVLMSSSGAQSGTPPKMTDDEKIEWYCSQPANQQENCEVHAKTLLPYISDYAKYPGLDTRGQPLPPTRDCEWTGSCGGGGKGRGGSSGTSNTQTLSPFAGTPYANCPKPGDIQGTKDGYDSLLQLRFDLRPGAVGVEGFDYPGDFKHDIVRIAHVGATFRETPRGTNALVTVSRCPGDLNVAPACKAYMGGPGVLNVGKGTKCPLGPGQWFVNVAHRKLGTNQNSCTDQFKLGYCTAYLNIQ